MPNTYPRTTTLAALEHKLELARGAAAHLLFNFGAEPDNLPEVRRAAAHPAVKALKIYMGPSTGQGGLAPPAVQAHFRQAAELGLPVMVHAEDLARIEANAARFPHDVRHHHRLRSAEGELAAVRQALDWAREYGTRLYLAHCTLAGAVRLAEDSGIRERVFVEACPHHLLLSVDSIAGPAENRYKVNPPLRTEAERAELFACLGAGIDGLGSDHAPHTMAEKEAPYDRAPSGIPGVEHLFPLALDLWRRGTISLERLLALTSGNAARWFGLPKGALAVGADADLVLVDADAEWTLGAGDDRVASKCGWSLYDGRTLRARPVATVVAGRVVYRHGAGE
jgi:dihydroorotase